MGRTAQNNKIVRGRGLTIEASQLRIAAAVLHANDVGVLNQGGHRIRGQRHVDNRRYAVEHDRNRAGVGHRAVVIDEIGRVHRLLIVAGRHHQGDIGPSQGGLLRLRDGLPRACQAGTRDHDAVGGNVLPPHFQHHGPLELAQMNLLAGGAEEQDAVQATRQHPARVVAQGDVIHIVLSVERGDESDKCAAQALAKLVTIHVDSFMRAKSGQRLDFQSRRRRASDGHRLA